MTLTDGRTSLEHHMAKPNIDEQLATCVSEEPLAQLSDEDLVTAHLQGRNGAFDDLYERYYDRLVHFVTRKTGDGDRAQDLVQDAGEDGMVEEDLRRSTHRVPLFGWQRFGLARVLVLVLEDCSQFVLAQQAGQTDPALDIEGVSLPLRHRHDRSAVAVRGRQQGAIHRHFLSR